MYVSQKDTGIYIALFTNHHIISYEFVACCHKWTFIYLFFWYPILFKMMFLFTIAL